MEIAKTQTQAGNRSQSVRYLVEMAVLTAIMLLMEMTGLGIIRLPFFPGLEFAILQIPVLIGAIIMGPAAGGILGGMFGLISFWECFGKSAFGAVLLGINPVFTFLVCVPSRILMGVLCGLIFRALYKVDRHKIWSFGVAGLCGALLNTTFFMGSLVLFFYNTEFIQGFVQTLGAANPFLFVIAFVGMQGLIEAILCTVVGAAVSKALYKALHR